MFSDSTSNSQINKILSHPTLPTTITAHEDKNIRFFDNNSGESKRHLTQNIFSLCYTVHVVNFRETHPLYDDTSRRSDESCNWPQWIVSPFIKYESYFNSFDLKSLTFWAFLAGHDSSVRLWNLNSKTCVQDLTLHRRKFDESVHDVAFHPSKPYIASAGADALAKVYVWYTPCNKCRVCIVF